MSSRDMRTPSLPGCCRWAVPFRREPMRPTDVLVLRKPDRNGRSRWRQMSRLRARHGKLTDGHNAIGTAWHDCRIVCAKPLNRGEAARPEVEIDFVPQPAAH